ncbi:DUF2304 domain-containing protein [Lignipirellula cremea]|uniref:DUF2304 domain-containing protein n=1 Tax=Lignipirellula cremea TaxID=2528010 RepID=A0A518DM97_9BACT|nr:DUF2304 domain-containing protein [Lignipirellula cremea]QDU92966.1 hypothetical protein Pla8534_07390 [Lignipirellula cremea]
MNLFQLLTAPVLGLLCLWEIFRLCQQRTRLGLRLFRLSLWLATGLALLFPSYVQAVAASLGIGRGADAVLYLLVFAFLIVSWWFYAENQRLRRDLTELIRQQAIGHAQHRPRSAAPDEHENSL